MKEYQSLSHTRWDCKYHVVFIPKRRKKAIYAALRKHLGEIFRVLAQQRECKVVEGHLAIDQVCGIKCGWFHQREECDFDSAPFRRQAKKFYRGGVGREATLYQRSVSTKKWCVPTFVTRG